MKHLVVIGDIVRSRGIKGRAAFQKRLAAALEEVSRRPVRRGGGAGLASPYTLTLGDEFQAVYARAGGVFVDLCRVRLACWPERVRLVLAAGRIDTAINPRQALGMDGPAFHAARGKIEALKANGVDFGLGGEMPGDAARRDALIDLASAQCEGWTRNRWAILLGLLEERPVAELAAELGISEAAVYKNIRHARLAAWVTVLRAVENDLDAALARKS